MRSLTIFILLVNLACATKNYPPNEELAITYAFLEDARISGGEAYAPDLMMEARSFYERAEMEYEAGNYEESELLREIAEIRAKTVISMGRKGLHEEETERLRAEIDEANSAKSVHQEELRENVLRLEQIKDRMAVSQDLMRSKALDMLEDAGTRIESAKSVSAGDFSPTLLAEAHQAYKASQENLSRGEYERSIELSGKAAALAGKAYDDSKSKFDLTGEVKDRISSIYGAEVERTNGGIKAVFPGLFAPSGTNIVYDAYPSLDALARVLSEYSGFQVSIEAYTNDLESDEGNLELSQKRAEKVKEYLMSKGLPAERLKVWGLGDDKLLVDQFGNRPVVFLLSLDGSGRI